MSVHKSVRVECDVYRCFGEEAGSLREVRQILNRRGWYMKRGVDLCPKHKPSSGTESSSIEKC